MRAVRRIAASVLVTFVSIVMSVAVASSSYAADIWASLDDPVLSMPSLGDGPSVPMPKLEAPKSVSTNITLSPNLDAPSAPSVQMPSIGSGSGSTSITLDPSQLQFQKLPTPSLSMPQLPAVTLPSIGALPAIGVPNVPGAVAGAAAQTLGLPTVYLLPSSTTPGTMSAVGSQMQAVEVKVRLARSAKKAARIPVSTGTPYSVTVTGSKSGTATVSVLSGGAWTTIGKVKASKKATKLPTFVAPAAGEYLFKVSTKKHRGFVRVSAS